MEKGERVVVALLILAIVFSVFSIVLSIGVMNMDLPKKTSESNYVSGNGVASVGFSVERANGGQDGK